MTKEITGTMNRYIYEKKKNPHLNYYLVLLLKDKFPESNRFKITPIVTLKNICPKGY